MTREEAKKIIFSQWQSFLEHNIDYGGISEAYKMAMKALEQQSSDDCISREEAIRIAEQGQIQGYEWQFKKLCTLPSVTPQQANWIPIKDISELPKDKILYVTVKAIIDGETFYEVTELYWDMTEWSEPSRLVDNVVAYMIKPELPEPYRESEE